MEDNLATPRKATNVSRILLSRHFPIHTLWPSLPDRSGILLQPAPSTSLGDLRQVISSQCPIFILQGLGGNYLILTVFCGIK